MEQLSRYRQILIAVLSDLAELSSQPEAQAYPLFDTRSDNYAVLRAGWRDINRIHTIIAHIRLQNGKVWVEADNTDREIVQQLVTAGIPHDAIVLAFYSPQKRQFTEFAVA